MAKTYLNEEYQARLDALAKQLEAQNLQSDYEAGQAAIARKEANRLAANTYMQAINPYGYAAEKLAQEGLSNTSGVGNRLRANAYRAQQGAYGTNAGAYLTNLGNIGQTRLKNQYQSDADSLGALGDYNKSLYEEALRQQQLKQEKDLWLRDYKLRKKQSGL